jgi:hypothetical protein
MNKEEIADLFPEKPFKIEGFTSIVLLLPYLKCQELVWHKEVKYYHHSRHEIERLNLIKAQALRD